MAPWFKSKIKIRPLVFYVKLLHVIFAQAKISSGI
jgi:hypothetical protein